MNLYGDRGNVLVLAWRARARKIDVQIKGVTVGQSLPADADIIFFGGGQDQEQALVGRDLAHKQSTLGKFLLRGGGLLAVCGGYQLLGSYYQPLSGPKITGLGLLPIYTVAGRQRMIGDLVIDSERFGQLIGFENHSGQTFLEATSETNKSAHPLGKIVIGHGNNGQDHTEGVVIGSAYGTYLHGPVLSKNPTLADDLIAHGLSLHGDDPRLMALPEKYLEEARNLALVRARPRRASSLGWRS